MTKTNEMIKNFIKRDFSSFQLYFVVLIGIVVFLSEYWIAFIHKIVLHIEFESSISFVYILSNAIPYSAYPYLFSVLCAIIGTKGLCEDLKNKHIKVVSKSVPKENYIKARFISSTLVGGLAALFTIIISSMLLRTIFPAHTTDSVEIIDKTAMFLNGWGYVLKIAIAYFFTGVFTTSIALICTILTRNRYVAIILPAILFIFSYYICVFFMLPISPLDLIMTYSRSAVTLIQSVSWSLLITSVTYLAFKYKILKKLEEI